MGDDEALSLPDLVNDALTLEEGTGAGLGGVSRLDTLADLGGVLLLEGDREAEGDGVRVPLSEELSVRVKGGVDDGVLLPVPEAVGVLVRLEELLALALLLGGGLPLLLNDTDEDKEGIWKLEIVGLALGVDLRILREALGDDVELAIRLDELDGDFVLLSEGDELGVPVMLVEALDEGRSELLAEFEPV